LRYMNAKFSAYRERIAYELYIADVLKAIGPALGVKVTKSLADIILPERVAVDTRSGDEIAADVIARLGLKTDERI